MVIDTSLHSLLFGTSYVSRYNNLIFYFRTNLARINTDQKGGAKSDYVRRFHKHPEVYKPFLILMLLSVVQMFRSVN